MKSATLVLTISALMLAGCSGGAGLLNGKESVPSAANVPVGNSLAMPPDLQLAAPGGTSDAYQPNGPVAAKAAPAAATRSAALAAPSTGGVYGNAPAAKATGDIFDQYGISKFKPDGTKKSGYELNEELRAAMIAKRRQTNPGYGTIANVGSIFKDQ